MVVRTGKFHGHALIGLFFQQALQLIELPVQGGKYGLQLLPVGVQADDLIFVKQPELTLQPAVSISTSMLF